MAHPTQPILLVVIGPTGVGKTAFCLSLAKKYGVPILNADSRQVYRALPIGTAAPTKAEQEQVSHYFVGCKELEEEYNAGQYERDALQCIASLLPKTEGDAPLAILSGGSMLYIDAVCQGLDDIPAVDPAVRESVRNLYQSEGLSALQREVQHLDPAYWVSVDTSNPQRLMHCIEVCRSIGKPYSSLRLRAKADRPFRVLKVGLLREREELYERINKRVDQMIAQGLEQEVKSAFEYMHVQPGSTLPNSLNTVGYREWYEVLNGRLTREQAIDKIKQNSRHYAKRQLTWWRRDTTIHWIDATQDLITQLDIVDNWLHECSMYE